MALLTPPDSLARGEVLELGVKNDCGRALLVEGDDTVRRSQWPHVARQLLTETSDRELLERYVLKLDDDAFAQLMHRYSRLVNSKSWPNPTHLRDWSKKD